MTDAIAELLSAQGPFAHHLPNFQVRVEQQQLASQIAQAQANSEVLIAEAGTGTGKTFAYLVPTLRSGKKILLSTGTRHLQDQLYWRDLPLVKKILQTGSRVALLKGRNNYLCKHRLVINAVDARFQSLSLLAEYQAIISWEKQTHSGDIAELPAIAEDSAIWPLVTSQADNCLGKECAYFNECYLVKARRQALAADILVINHHLFFADLLIRQEGFGELLPNFNGIVFDEAHQLPPVAQQFFSQTWSTRQVSRLVQDIQAELKQQPNTFAQLRELCQALLESAQAVRQTLPLENTRGAWQDLQSNHGLTVALTTVHQDLTALHGELAIAQQTSKSLRHLSERAQAILASFTLMTHPAPENQIHWYETFKRSLVIYQTPIRIDKRFAEVLNQEEKSWVFTSATLAVNQSVAHFADTLGLTDYQSMLLDSPFAYQSQALVYLPKNMPLPQHENFIPRLCEEALALLEISQGRMFYLFTSYRAMHAAATYLSTQLDCPILVQGTLPKKQLLERFLKQQPAVLLGTISFWEGVDVRGEALQCVILEKLPFTSPNDPLTRAKHRALTLNGQDPFYDDQLPHAVITLKQGFGRLIRDINDRGLLVIGDPRMQTRAYGGVFFNSLPALSITRHRHIACHFLANCRAQANNQDNATAEG